MFDAQETANSHRHVPDRRVPAVERCANGLVGLGRVPLLPWSEVKKVARAPDPDHAFVDVGSVLLQQAEKFLLLRDQVRQFREEPVVLLDQLFNHTETTVQQIIHAGPQFVLLVFGDVGVHLLDPVGNDGALLLDQVGLLLVQLDQPQLNFGPFLFELIDVLLMCRDGRKLVLLPAEQGAELMGQAGGLDAVLHVLQIGGDGLADGLRTFETFRNPLCAEDRAVVRCPFFRERLDAASHVFEHRCFLYLFQRFLRFLQLLLRTPFHVLADHHLEQLHKFFQPVALR